MTEYKDDYDFINGLKSNSEKYQRLLVDRYGEYLLSLVMKYSLSREDAREVVQDTFYKTIKKIHIFNSDKGTKFSTWLTQIAINTARDKLRKLNQIPSEDSIEDRAEKGIQVIKGLYQDANCPDSDAGILSKNILEKALSKLTENDRTILMERAYDQQFKEIGILLNKKENTVKVAYHRALERLKDAYITILESLEDEEMKRTLNTYLK